LRSLFRPLTGRRRPARMHSHRRLTKTGGSPRRSLRLCGGPFHGPRPHFTNLHSSTESLRRRFPNGPAAASIATFRTPHSKMRLIYLRAAHLQKWISTTTRFGPGLTAPHRSHRLRQSRLGGDQSAPVCPNRLARSAGIGWLEDCSRQGRSTRNGSRSSRKRCLRPAIDLRVSWLQRGRIRILRLHFWPVELSRT
jgi:hypothetical protein